MMMQREWIELNNGKELVWINLSRVCNIRIVATADNKAIVYINKENGVGNLMISYENFTEADDAIRKALGMVASDAT